MSSLRRIAAITHTTATLIAQLRELDRLLAQLRELDRLRERLREAQLSARVSRRTNYRITLH
jgi:hypothetical protein